MTFNKKQIIDLDRCVINALELFIKKKVPRLQLGGFKRPLVVGSGNAAVTGRIILSDKDAVFADEGNYKQKLKAVKDIDGCVLLSASGGKHAPIIAKELKRRRKKVVLVTNNPNALAKRYADKTYVLPKNTEPYTYNTSTYMGMILAKTKENPRVILNHIKKIKSKIPRNLRRYDSFYIIVPEELDNIREMFLTKFSELFGPKVSGRVFTVEQTKHAKTVISSDKELFISLGHNNKIFGKKRLNIPLPRKAGYASIMAVGYYIIGQIQKQHPPYFKNSIEAYAKRTSKMFGQTIKPIVE